MTHLLPEGNVDRVPNDKASTPWKRRARWGQAPGRRDPQFLNNRSAFDVAFEIAGDEAIAIVGVETKDCAGGGGHSTLDDVGGEAERARLSKHAVRARLSVVSEMPEDVWQRVVAIVDAMVEGSFVDLGADGRAGRCEPADLERVVREYGRSLRRLPLEARGLVHVHACRDGSLSVDVPLWTAEEGRSDLMLCVECQRSDAGWSVVIDDLLVP